MRHCRSVSSTDVLWVHQLVLPPQAFGSSVRSGNVRVSLFFLQFLCSIGEPFLRADLAPQGRRTEPRSRLAKGLRRRRHGLDGGEHGARLVVRDEDRVAVGRQTALRRMTTQAGWWIITMSAIQPERAMCTIL